MEKNIETSITEFDKARLCEIDFILGCVELGRYNPSDALIRILFVLRSEVSIIVKKNLLDDFLSVGRPT